MYISAQGLLYADKGYCVKPAIEAAAKHGIHLAAIKKNNMLNKNRDLDCWITKMRSPYVKTESTCKILWDSKKSICRIHECHML
jgi:hypothetical protein